LPTTALVLGGGGVTGVAWELGLLIGLRDAGVDLGAAELVVGTSAGAVVAAQLTSGAPLERAYEAQLAGPGAEAAARMGRRALAAWMWAMLTTRDPLAYRARIGRLASRASTVPEGARRAIIESRLPSRTWPERPLLITAVDAESGEFVAFDRDSGVSLVDAVGASCAVPGVWPPVTINGRRWIDGGVRGPVNADLAAGCDRIVVIAPIVAGFGAVTRPAAQIAQLGRAAEIVMISPDAASKAAIGRNVLDPARRAPAARAGRTQAAQEAERVGAVWKV
jgi:NTE family protein